LEIEGDFTEYLGIKIEELSDGSRVMTILGFLDKDDIPSEQALWVENIVFPLDGTAPTGTYQYFVNNFNQGGPSADNWKVEVYLDGGAPGDIPVQTQFGVTPKRGISTIFTFEFV
jgi:hypothetical protein